MRTDRTHYTVPEREAFDIALHKPPSGMIVNCFSCYGVQTKGLPDKHTIAWSPLDKIPASAKRRALEMIMTPEPAGKEEAWECTCSTKVNDWRGHHAAHCFYHIPF